MGCVILEDDDDWRTILVLSPFEAKRFGPLGLVEGRDYILRKELPMAKKGKSKPKPKPKPRPTGY